MARKNKPSSKWLEDAMTTQFLLSAMFYSRDIGHTMGAGTGWAGWASAHPGNNLGGHSPP